MICNIVLCEHYLLPWFVRYVQVQCRGKMRDATNKKQKLIWWNHCISSVIRFFFSFQNNLKGLDPSCKMDLDLWVGFGRENPIL